MAERSLNNRFIELEDNLISVNSLMRQGRANEIPFYIFDYNPKDEINVRKEVVKIKSRNSEIVEFDLYEMMLSIIEEEGYLEDVLRMEKDYDKDILLREIFQPLLSVEENDNRLIEMFKERATDDGKHIVLITGVGKAFPIIRSHTILNNLQSVFRNNPVVMMYPGRYEIKKAMTLRLFERLDDDNYCQSFYGVSASADTPIFMPKIPLTIFPE